MINNFGKLFLGRVIYQHLCLVDSEVLRNPPLRQAAKRQIVKKLSLMFVV